MMPRQLKIEGGDDPPRGPVKPISVYLPPDVYEQVEHRAQQEDRSISNFVKWCVLRVLRGDV
jgi:hypothetical protein